MKETRFKETEVGMIPVEWECVSLGDIGEVRMCKRVMKYQTSEQGDIPFYKIGTFGNKADAFITYGLFCYLKSKYNYPKKGDVLLSAAGTIGRAVVFDGKESYFQDSNIVWIENDEKKLYNALLFYIYKTLSWVTESGTIPRIYNAIVSSIKFAIPTDKKEQERIASALSNVDDLIGELGRLIDKKRAIKEGAMQELLTGKKRLPGFKGEWVEKKIKDFTDIVTGATPSTVITDYWQGGTIRWMSSGELNNKFIYDVEGRITQKGYDNSGTNNVPPHCVLVGLAGQGKTRGTAAYNYVSLCTNQSIAAILPKDKFFDSLFVYYFIDSQYKELRQISAGDGGRGGLNKQILLDFSIPLPSLDEQHAIATLLNNMDSEIKELEEKRDKYVAIKRGMMEELLTGRIRLIFESTTKSPK